MNEQTPRRNLNVLKAVTAAAVAGSLAVNAAEKPDMPPPPPDTPPDTPGDTVQAMPDQSSQLETVAYTTPSAHSYRRPLSKYVYTGYKVSGASSTFGYPVESLGRTADGGSTARPCFAIRNRSTLDHLFEASVKVNHHWHKAIMRQCDTGPAVWTGRNIDFTGLAARRLGLNPFHFPTGIYGVVRELHRRRHPHPHPRAHI